MLMITLMIFYVHVIIFHDGINEDKLDAMALHYLIMFHGHWFIDVDNYSLSKHMLDGMYGIYVTRGMNGL